MLLKGVALLSLSLTSLVGASMLAPVHTEAAFEVAVEVTWHGLPGGPFVVVAKPLSGQGEATRSPMKGEAGKIMLKKGAWSIVVERDGFWGAEEAVVVDQAGGFVRLAAWPTGTLGGTLVLPASVDHAPESLWISFSAAPRPQPGSPRGTIACPIRGMKWSCGVPAGDLDFQLNVPGYTTRYYWDQVLVSGKVRDLGPCELRRGASIVGWIEGPTGRSVPGARLSLAQEKDGKESLATQAVPNARGFFQITSVPPGAYDLRASAPAAAEVKVPLRVVEGTETRLSQPIVLSPPASLVVTIDPPWPPGGLPWRVELLSTRDLSHVSLDPTLPTEIAPDGKWRKTGLAQGRYVVSILADGEQRWWSEQVVLAAGDVNELSIRMSSLRVLGTVSLAGRPLAAARLLFGAGYSDVAMAATADGEGRFVLELPRHGKWTVQVEADEPSVRRTLTGVDVEPTGTGQGKVNVDLPGVVVKGVVRDESGSPRVAVVTGISDRADEPSAWISSQADGSFEFHGLSPGLLKLVARVSTALYSEPAVVNVGEHDSDRRVDLVLKGSVPVRGTVFTSEGAVAGARVHVFPIPFAGPTPVWTTNEDGLFELTVPQGTSELAIAVRAPGYGYKMLRQALVPGDSVLVILEREGGVLRVALPETDAIRSAFVMHNGGFSGLLALRAWAVEGGQGGQVGSEVIVPGMAPGSYSVCLGTRSDLQAALRDGPPRGPCATGVLTEGGVLDLTVPPGGP